MIFSFRPVVGTRRIQNYVDSRKRNRLINAALPRSKDGLLHIIRRFTQYFRNDYMGVEQWSRDIVRGHYIALLDLHKQHQRFAAVWDRNLSLQGFAEAFTDAAIRG